MPDHTITIGYKTPEGTMTGADRKYTADGSFNVEVAVPAGATNMQVIVGLDTATLKSCGMTASKALTVKTNSSSSPTDTIALADGQVRAWGHDTGDPALFTADVTALFLTNAGAAASTFRFRALSDVTPGA